MASDTSFGSSQAAITLDTGPADTARPDTTQTTLSRWLPTVGLLLVIAVQGAFILSHCAPAIAAPDANGYWAQGTRLFSDGRNWFRPEADPQYIGMHWLVTSDGRYFSRYPPGLAVVVGLVYRLAGYRATVLVNPLLASLSLPNSFSR